MKLDKTFNLRELPKEIRQLVQDLMENHVRNLIQDYDETLRQEGMCLEAPDKEELTKHMSESAKVTIKITSDVDDEKLEKWHIYPRDMKQSTLVFEEAV